MCADAQEEDQQEEPSSSGRTATTNAPDRPSDKTARDPRIDKDQQRSLENELRDPKNFVEFFLPRPLRLTVLGGGAASCALACWLCATRVAANAQVASADGTLRDLGINLVGFLLFLSLFLWDQRQGGQRIERRSDLRRRQIDFGDREVFYNEAGGKMSRLKDVDDEWILRRLERWGERDKMPFIGPQKAEILQRLVREHQPRNVVEVGTMCGYSALKMAQALPEGAVGASYQRHDGALVGIRHAPIGNVVPAAMPELRALCTWYEHHEKYGICILVTQEKRHSTRQHCNCTQAGASLPLSGTGSGCLPRSALHGKQQAVAGIRPSKRKATHLQGRVCKCSGAMHASSCQQTDWQDS